MSALDRALTHRLERQRQMAGALDRLRLFLADNGLIDALAEQQLARAQERLAGQQFVVAFVAEFSRGKSELINALLFADQGARLLPSSAGRTTMCPTEIGWRAGDTPEIRLLPIETRRESLSPSALPPEAWQSFALDTSSTAVLAEGLKRVSETLRMTPQDAGALGFAPGPAAQDGLVEVPRWRHARIRLPHPLLTRGLVILDTPGLNAIGAEPELTLSMLPAAHAVLFVLAADTGVTQSDLAIWRDALGNIPNRRAVLNKIDGLWDGLRSESEIAAELDRQVRSVSQHLGLPAERIFPVSAQKGLYARIHNDAPLFSRSRLPQLIEALAGDIDGTTHDGPLADALTISRQVASQAQATLHGRQTALHAQMSELLALRNRSDAVLLPTLERLRAEKEAFEKELKDYYALRAVHGRLGDTLLKTLGPAALREDLRACRDAMKEARLSPQLVKAMVSVFGAARRRLDEAERQAGEIRAILGAMVSRLGPALALTLPEPAEYSPLSRLPAIDRLEESLRRQVASFMNLLIRDRQTIVKQFFETAAAQLKALFEEVDREAEEWLRTTMQPLESQIRERQAQLKRRQSDMRRIYETADTLEEKIGELTQEQAAAAELLRELDHRLQLCERSLNGTQEKE